MGNPLTYDGWTYTWEGGRQLKQMVKSDGSTIQYKYDQDGLRTTKTIDGTSTRYVYDSGQLVSMKTANGTPLYFRYDTTGKPVSVKYENNEYFYVTNIFGDITGIVDKLGVSKVAYTYDAWGAPLTTTGTLASTLGAANPLRYRGYVFDSETGLYYLQSRYYNPQWKRFVNADAFCDTEAGAISTNMFAYCESNPVMFADPTGYYTLSKFNCYAYAFGINNRWMIPGKSDKRGDLLPSYYTVTDVIKWVIKDIGSSKVRQLSDKNSKLSSGEYRIAVRICWIYNPLPPGYKGPQSSRTLDFHFWKQNPKNSEWWDKHGSGSIEFLGKANPDTTKTTGWIYLKSGQAIIWKNSKGKVYATLNGPFYYNSLTLYLAFKGTFWST